MIDDEKPLLVHDEPQAEEKTQNFIDHKERFLKALEPLLPVTHKLTLRVTVRLIS